MGETRWLVVGSGAIGGVVAASLSEIGEDVTAVTTNAEIDRALRERGYQVVGDGPPRRAPAKTSLGVPAGQGKFDVVVLATQPPQVEEAATGARDVLADDGVMLVLQNGLCEERVAKIVGEERVLGAVVGWGATMPEPGMYEKTAQGGFTIGTISGKPLAPKHEAACRALECVGPVELTDNLRGKRWSKLAINCAISTLGTLGADRLGAIMPNRFVRRLALEIMTEVVHVAKKEGVRLEKVSGTLDLPWMALTEEERAASGSPSLVAKHGMLLAVGFRYRRMKSSMLSAIERGRTPAVDFLNGEVVTRAKAHGMSAPVNAAARDLVWQIKDGKKTGGIPLLRELFGMTGPHGA